MDSQNVEVGLVEIPTISQIELRPSYKSTIISCMLGNALEWYDFVIYGYFAVIFGALFFPNSDPLTQMLASWGVFWAGFIARPLGSIIFGHIGDKTSRKHALTLSIYFMAIPTALIGLLPPHASIGVLAPILLILLRSMQGFAMGGEFTGSMIFLVEHAPSEQRGFWGSWVSFSAVCGVISGSLLVAILNLTLSNGIMNTWGWRLPFVLSILGSILCGYMRNNLQDPISFLENKAKQSCDHTPLKELFQKYKRKIGLIILLDFLAAIAFFIIAIFMATYMKTYLMFPDNVVFIINTANMVVFAAAILLGGWLADRYPLTKTLGYPCLAIIIFSYPLFSLMQPDTYPLAFMVQCIMSIIFGIFFGALPSALVSIMPQQVRCSGISIAHNISMAIFGGSAPFLATSMIGYTQDIASPAFLLVIAGLLSYNAVLRLADAHEA